MDFFYRGGHVAHVGAPGHPVRGPLPQGSPLGPTHVLAPHEPIVKATMTNATIAFTNYTPPVRTASH